MSKDSQARTVVKTFSWRITATITTFLIAYFIFHEDPDVFMKSGAVAAIELVLKLALYYFHERFWTNLKWGKVKEQDID